MTLLFMTQPTAAAHVSVTIQRSGMPQRSTFRLGSGALQPNERRALPVPQKLLPMRSSRIVGVGQTAQQQAFNNVVKGTPKGWAPKRRLEAIPQ